MNIYILLPESIIMFLHEHQDIAEEVQTLKWKPLQKINL